MSHTSRVVARLQASGCAFTAGAPDTAQYKCRGQEPNTWLVRREVIRSRMTLSDQVPWVVTGSNGRSSSGHEIILDLPAQELARTPCLIGYSPRNDPWVLCLTSLDGLARTAQMLLGPRPEFAHWLAKKRPAGPAGHYCNLPKYGRCRAIIVETRYFGQEDVDPQVGVRVWDQSRDVEWLRLSEVEVGKSIGA